MPSSPPLFPPYPLVILYQDQIDVYREIVKKHIELGKLSELHKLVEHFKNYHSQDNLLDLLDTLIYPNGAVSADDATPRFYPLSHFCLIKNQNEIAKFIESLRAEMQLPKILDYKDRSFAYYKLKQYEEPITSDLKKLIKRQNKDEVEQFLKAERDQDLLKEILREVEFLAESKSNTKNYFYFHHYSIFIGLQTGNLEKGKEIADLLAKYCGEASMTDYENRTYEQYYKDLQAGKGASSPPREVENTRQSGDVMSSPKSVGKNRRPSPLAKSYSPEQQRKSADENVQIPPAKATDRDAQENTATEIIFEDNQDAAPAPDASPLASQAFHTARVEGEPKKGFEPSL